MQIIADLHTHSKYSRAVSAQMAIPYLAFWAERKGTPLIGTGDFTHPLWWRHIRSYLEEDGAGLLRLKKGSSQVRFMLTSEISCVFSRGGIGRRLHVLVFLPDFASVERLNARLGTIGNLRADGRPVIGLDAKELARLALEITPDAIIIPAHIWTPWFGLLGSKSGFDSLRACFEEVSEHILAVETGLSSDPPMNWRVSELDTKSIVSFADGHSGPNLGREATIFELQKISYSNMRKALSIPFPTPDDANRISGTIEFYPEEGMYHWDGHRAHGIHWHPDETRAHNGRCPVCHRPVTVGVMNRVDQLADRPEGYRAKKRPPYYSLISLPKIIGDVWSIGVSTKKVQSEYERLINEFGNEIRILLDLRRSELSQIAAPEIVEGILAARAGEVMIVPGYDGVYGRVKLQTFKTKPKGML